MKKYLSVLSTVVVILTLLSGCSSTDSSTVSGNMQQTPKPSADSSTVSGNMQQTPKSSADSSTVFENMQQTLEPSADASVSSKLSSIPPALSEQNNSSLFQTGTWLATGGNAAACYFFDTDGYSGHIIFLTSGMGIGFTYTIQDTRATFYMGSADSDSAVNCTLQLIDAEHFVMSWQDGQKETLTFVSEQDPDNLQFYTDDQLCELALSYYYSMAGETGELTASAETNEDGSVTIQVYENLPEHVTTYAWYTVDRFTGKGTDIITDVIVDLSIFGTDLLYQDAVTWFSNQSTEYEFIDGTVCGDAVVLLTGTRDYDDYQMLQVFVLEKNGDSFEVSAMRDCPYNAPCGFSAYVLVTDNLTVVFGENQDFDFTEINLLMEDGLTQRWELAGNRTYLIALEEKQTIKDVIFAGSGRTVYYSDYIDGNLMDM